MNLDVGASRFCFYSGSLRQVSSVPTNVRSLDHCRHGNALERVDPVMIHGLNPETLVMRHELSDDAWVAIRPRLAEDRAMSPV